MSIIEEIQLAQEVIPSKEARDQLPRLLAQFKQSGAECRPVIFGPYRRPEGVLLSYELYCSLLEDARLGHDVKTAEKIQKRVANPSPNPTSMEDVMSELGISQEEIR